MTKEIELFLDKVRIQLESNQATEHSYRPALKALLNSLDESIEAINEPKQSEHGAPDFVVIGKKNKDLKLGYGEAKIPGENLDKIEKSEQMDRYKGYANLFLTDCLDWRFFRNGEKILELRIGELSHDKTEISKLYTDRYSSLASEIANFLGQPPEKIRSGRRLAEIMGGKARRIRDNILLREQKNPEIENIYKMMTKLLVHDLSYEKFADMYSQTLIYGLFVARYMDTTEKDFSRQEARDLVPKSNPFLRQFFDHVAGINFDASLGYIIDELCDVFAISDIHTIVHKHLRVTGEEQNDKDPIIHFYEDFLQEYDPQLKKQMGAYYTPVPVVRYIVKQIDRVLKEDFGIQDGIASTETIKQTVDAQGHTRGKYGKKVYTTKEVVVPRVQILDPAVGTATFLNETIKYIYNHNFENQKGLWPSYVNDNLIKRLFGFELMMAPYTIAHMKLGMTLAELGATELKGRIGVYLTNSLEEGIPMQPDLLSFGGLVAAVTEESDAAAEIKSNAPVMIVMGNPPYSVSSSNKSRYAAGLVAPYKKDLNERKINLDDDYIKFIAFSEQMIEKNGSGVVGMITNNSFIDGITHREMRHHLRKTFDKIYILDLHGNSKKKETAPDGGPDQNVFDIMQGVSIIIAVKTGTENKLADVYHAEVYGKRADKFAVLNHDQVKFSKVNSVAPRHYFVPKDMSLTDEYEANICINDLFINKSSGFRSGAADSQICFERNDIENVVQDLIKLPELDFRAKYNLKDGRNHYYAGMKEDIGNEINNSRIIQTAWHSPFDVRWTYYSYKSSGFVARPRNQTMDNFVGHENIGLIYMRGHIEPKGAAAGVTNLVSSERTFSRPGMSSADSVAPLYIYVGGSERISNFNADELRKLTAMLERTFEPEDIFDYIYAILHSPSYRKKYAESLKMDFPRVPIPTQKDFDRLVALGRQLRELHLMTVYIQFTTSYPEFGNNLVEKVEWVGNKVYINTNQYFGGVPDNSWNFYIGGYQPAQKWLKDRKGRVLSSEDIVHYQKIIKILDETDRIMKEIDK